MGCARAPASLLADVEDGDEDDVALPVLLLEPDPPDVVDEPELLPLVLEPPVVPLVLLPPDVVPLVLEPLPTVPLVELEPGPTPVEGATTGMRVVLLTAAGGVYVGVPAGLVATAGWVVTGVGWVVTADGWVVTGVGIPVTTPRELVWVVKDVNGLVYSTG